MTVLAVLQARMSSTRLPGKVLAPILGRPMLERHVERLRRARRYDRLVVATSTRADDDAIAALCADIGIDCHRGSLDDVLDRFHGAVRRWPADHVVRLTADCPLADPEVIDAAIALALESGADYVSNVDPPTWPDGLDVEVIRAAALDAAWREATLPAEREHVTPFIRTCPERFRHANLAAPVDRSGMRWVVDTAADLAMVRRVYARLYPADAAFTTDDILALLAAAPEIAALNQAVPRPPDRTGPREGDWNA